MLRKNNQWNTMVASTLLFTDINNLRARKAAVTLQFTDINNARILKTCLFSWLHPGTPVRQSHLWHLGSAGRTGGGGDAGKGQLLFTLRVTWRSAVCTHKDNYHIGKLLHQVLAGLVRWWVCKFTATSIFAYMLTILKMKSSGQH